MIKRLIWTIWTPMSSVLKKADKLNLSLSLSVLTNYEKSKHIFVLKYFLKMHQAQQEARKYKIMSAMHIFQNLKWWS